MTIDRRTKIQEFLDWEWPGWVAVGPDRGDLADLCVLKNREGDRVQLDLPQSWFDDKKWSRIKAEIRRAIAAQTKQAKD